VEDPFHEPFYSMFEVDPLKASGSERRSRKPS
jgi:hypothetical protein